MLSPDRFIPLAERGRRHRASWMNTCSPCVRGAAQPVAPGRGFGDSAGCRSTLSRASLCRQGVALACKQSSGSCQPVHMDAACGDESRDRPPTTRSLPSFRSFSATASASRSTTSARRRNPPLPMLGCRLSIPSSWIESLIERRQGAGEIMLRQVICA